jgi:hypothetical protein
MLNTDIFFLYCCAGWGYRWHLQRSLHCINYIILEFTPSTAPLYPPHPALIHGTVSTSIIFVFTYMCTHFCTVFTLPPCALSPPPLPSYRCQPSPLGRTCSAFILHILPTQHQGRKLPTQNLYKQSVE